MKEDIKFDNNKNNFIIVLVLFYRMIFFFEPVKNTQSMVELNTNYKRYNSNVRCPK